MTQENKKNTTEVKLPAFMSKDTANFVPDISLSETNIPILKVVQYESTEFKQRIADYGDFINSVTKENLGTELEIVVLKIFYDFKVFVNKTLVDYSSDGINWSTGKGQIPKEDIWKHRFINLYVYINDESRDLIPYLISLGGSSFKAGKGLINLLAQKCTALNLPSFAKPICMSSIEMKNKNDTYKVYQFTENTKKKFVSEYIYNEAKKNRPFLEKVLEDKKAKINVRVTDTPLLTTNSSEAVTPKNEEPLFDYDY